MAGVFAVAFNQPLARPRPMPADPTPGTPLPGQHDKQDWLRRSVVAIVCAVIHIAYMCTRQLPALLHVIQMTFSHYRCMRRLIHIYVYHTIRHHYIYIRMQPQATHPPREAERCGMCSGCGLGDRMLREGHTSDSLFRIRIGCLTCPYTYMH